MSRYTMIMSKNRMHRKYPEREPSIPLSIHIGKTTQTSFIHVVYSPVDQFRPYQGCHMTKMIITFHFSYHFGFFAKKCLKACLFHKLQDQPQWDVLKQSSYCLGCVVFVPYFVKSLAGNQYSRTLIRQPPHNTNPLIAQAKFSVPIVVFTIYSILIT